MPPAMVPEQSSPKPGHRRVRQRIERVVFISGLALLSIYGAALLHRAAGSRAAVAVIEAASAEPNAEHIAAAREEAVDFKLWSQKRINAYRDSLRLLQGDPLAVVAMERLGIKAPVFAGTDDLVLNRGVGWITGTARPGEPGNSGIAGHRDGFFRALKDVVVGDSLVLQTRSRRLVYRVDEIVIVFPENVEVLRPRGGRSITLVTCYPFYFAGDAPQRFVVHARLEEELPGQ